MLFSSYVLRAKSRNSGGKTYLITEKVSQPQSAEKDARTTLERSKTLTLTRRNMGKKYVDAETASAIDIALMRFTEHGWFLEQLMELAGLAVADVLDAEMLFIKGKEDAEEEERPRRRILFLCGPGNNGGDGLVAAKHLSLRGFDVDIWHPKLNSALGGALSGGCWKNEKLFTGLYYSCKAAGCRFLRDGQLDLLVDGDGEPDFEKPKLLEYRVVVDALFGFSFKGEPREPYKQVLEAVSRIRMVKTKDRTTVLSVDIPSGDDVNEGPTQYSIHPDALVSLTAPKKCVLQRARLFLKAHDAASSDLSHLAEIISSCRHYLGGRFISAKLVEQFKERADLKHWKDTFDQVKMRSPQYVDLGRVGDIVADDLDDGGNKE